jgi:hypothetical protein
VLPDLDAHGIALFAISYDSVEILGGFADKHGIRFPLLSDEGSRVIRQLGLINERVQEDHAVYGIKPNPRHVDLPYPGVFVLDEAGVIVQKRFHASYRERDTGGALLATALGILEPGSSPSAASAGEAVAVRAWLDSPTYSFFQRLHVHVELHVAPGFHVYGAPAPDGMAALAARVAPIDGVEVGPASWPAAHAARLAGLDEEVSLHEGTIRGSLPLTFAAAPGAGDHEVKLEVTYQACSDALCLPSRTLQLTLPVTEVALVDRTLPTRPKSG